MLLAAGEATSDALGAAIAEATAAKILLPCRHTDVRLTLGPNMIAEGWRPDRLHPAWELDSLRNRFGIGSSRAVNK